MTLARQGEGVNTWPWTEDLLDDLEAAVSPERLSTYLTAAGGDRKRALQLYTWNTEMSAAFYGPLQGLEIALRNAIHQQLTRCYSAAWPDNPAVGLDLGGLERIAAAKTETARAGHTATPARLESANGRKSPPLQAPGRADAGQPAQQQSEVATGRLDEHPLAHISRGRAPTPAAAPRSRTGARKAAPPAPRGGVEDDGLGRREYADGSHIVPWPSAAKWGVYTKRAVQRGRTARLPRPRRASGAEVLQADPQAATSSAALDIEPDGCPWCGPHSAAVA